ncbi:MAG: NADH-quinone oxidoreductase subunit J [Legionellaceae bacterium]|nr:NADH-quinone oxidoreductase subunit J [Legionellaceae bacterium]
MHVLLEQTIFYIFAALTVLSATMVILQSNPVRSVLFLVFTFFAAAVLWMLAYAEFLALILILVYVGAVMTLFLFIVMMLHVDQPFATLKHWLRFLPLAVILLGGMLGILWKVFPVQTFVKAAPEAVWMDGMPVQAAAASVQGSNTEAIGKVIFTEYVYVFEIAAVLLLSSIIAAITLILRKERRFGKRQDVTQQMMTDPRRQVRNVIMKSDKE